MSQATLSVRLEEKDKKNFEKFCTEVGMNVSVAVNMYIKKVIREQRIPFTIESDAFYSMENMNELKKRAKDIEDGKYEVHELIED